MDQTIVQNFIEELVENCNAEKQVEEFRGFLEQLAEEVEGTEEENFFMTLSEAALEIQKEYEYERGK